MVMMALGSRGALACGPKARIHRKNGCSRTSRLMVLSAADGASVMARRAMLTGGVGLALAGGLALGDVQARADTLEAEVQKPPALRQTANDVIDENVEFDKKYLFGRSNEFPEEIREKQTNLVKKDEYVAAVEIGVAFEVIRKELFFYGCLSLFPAVAFYLKKKKEYDQDMNELEDMYKPYSRGSKGYIDPKKKKGKKPDDNK